MGDRAKSDRPLLKHGKMPGETMGIVAEKSAKPLVSKLAFPGRNAQGNNTFGRRAVGKNQATEVSILSDEYSALVQRTCEHAFVAFAP
jgi:hypothetical protein